MSYKQRFRWRWKRGLVIEVVQGSEVKVGKQRGVRWFLERKEVIKQEEWVWEEVFPDGCFKLWRGDEKVGMTISQRSRGATNNKSWPQKVAALNLQRKHSSGFIFRCQARMGPHCVCLLLLSAQRPLCICVCEEAGPCCPPLTGTPHCKGADCCKRK